MLFLNKITIYKVFFSEMMRYSFETINKLNVSLKFKIMEKVLPKESQHVQAFFSKGTYSIEKDTLEFFTEIPNVQLSHSDGKSFKLQHLDCHDISTKNVPCMLSIFYHGHPTHRSKLPQENLFWEKKEMKLSKVFNKKGFPLDKILVITIHDEDFEKWHTEMYRFFVQNHVAYDKVKGEYIYDLNALQEFINGSGRVVNENEEPRTAGGGVLEPTQ